MRIRWPLCCNRLFVSDIRNCPQRCSESSVAENARAPGSPKCPTTTVVGLVSRQRSPAVPGTRSTSTNYAESILTMALLNQWSEHEMLDMLLIT